MQTEIRSTLVWSMDTVTAGGLAHQVVPLVENLCGFQSNSYPTNLRRSIGKWIQRYKYTNFAPAFTIWIAATPDEKSLGLGIRKPTGHRVRPWACEQLGEGKSLHRISIYFRDWNPDTCTWSEICLKDKQIEDAEEWFL